MEQMFIKGTLDVDWQPGLVVVRRGTFPPKKFKDGDTETLEGSVTGHAVIVATDPKYLIEATASPSNLKGIVRKIPRDSWVNAQKEAYVVWARNKNGFVPHAAGRAAAAFAEKQIGKPYNWNYLNRFNMASFYCSQLCWRAWEQAGYKLDWDTIGPGDIKSKDFIHPNELTLNRANAVNLVIIHDGKMTAAPTELINEQYAPTQIMDKTDAPINAGGDD